MSTNMGTRSKLALGASVVLLLWTFGADAQNSLTNPPFVAGSYSQYQRTVMSREEWAAARQGGPAYIDQLLRGLHQSVPEYPEWLRQRAVNENPNKTSAAKLHRLADNFIPFTREQIDRLVPALEHPDPSVVLDVRDTLTQIFGIWFVEGADWVYKPEDIRRPHKAAWRKFWSQNRDRYGKNVPLIINDLCLDARFVQVDSQLCLRVSIENHGHTDWKICTEVPGKVEGRRGPGPGEWEWTYTLLIDGREERPVLPAPYGGVAARAVFPSEPAALPDRPAHIERVLVPAGGVYTYTLNMAEAFPGFKPDTASTNIIARYTYGLDREHWGESLWRGELRSLPLRPR